MSKPRFGVNLNNRIPLINPQYTLDDLLSLSQVVEECGFDSVWVGDSLFSKPRYEPLLLLAAISQRTKHVKLGTACLVTATRNPLYLALEWATLDQMSGGRTILGACMGNVEKGVRCEYAALGLDFSRRVSLFEEGLSILRQLWTGGSVSFAGKHFHLDNVSFYSQTELKPLKPRQSPPPMWIVSNPRLMANTRTESKVRRAIRRAAYRIARYGDGWLTCCRACHPDEFREQYEQICTAVEEVGRDPTQYTMAYQVTMSIADHRDAAQGMARKYIAQYYPEFGGAVDLDEWGPFGTPDDIIAWLEEFSSAGANYFICRFASSDQFGQVQRFAREVLPVFH